MRREGRYPVLVCVSVFYVNVKGLPYHKLWKGIFMKCNVLSIRLVSLEFAFRLSEEIRGHQFQQELLFGTLGFLFIRFVTVERDFLWEISVMGKDLGWLEVVVNLRLN